MRSTTKVMLALGLAIGVAGVAPIGTPSPSLAQSFYYSDSGVRVYVGPRYRHHRYYRHRYYDDYAYYPRSRYRTWNGCPPRYTVQDGVCKPYRGY